MHCATARFDAHKRGVSFQIILDRSQRKQRYTSADFTAHAGILTYIDAAHAITHNKVMIIDRSVVITGNFNFTKKAKQKNVENLLVVRAASTVIIAGLKRESAQLGINSPRRGSAVFY